MYIHTHTHTYIQNGILFAHKKNKILLFATTQMDLEGIMEGKIIQTEKEKYYMFSLTCRIFKIKQI